MSSGRVVKAAGGGQWKGMVIDGTAFADSDWATLGAFEEWLPGEETITNAKKAPKGKKKKKTAAVDENTVIESAPKSKKGKKTNRKKESTEEGGMEEKKTHDEKKAVKRKNGDVTEEEMMKKAKTEEVIEEKETTLSKNQRKKLKRKLKEKVEEKAEEKDEVDSRKDEGDSDDALEEDEDGEVEITQTAKEPVDVSDWIPLCVPDIILKNIASQGFSSPTEIQQQVLPSAVRDRLDILGAAETGSGKTLAFVVPLLARLLEEQRVGAGPRGLILAPTRELVLQVRKHVDALSAGTPLRAVTIVGGLAQQKQERILKKRPEIIVATPGRLWALAEDGSYLADWSGMRCLVVDETDRMVEKGHFTEMEEIVKRIRREATEGKLQTLVFSATLTFVHLSTRPDMPSMDTDHKIGKIVSMTGLRKERRVFDVTRPVGTATTLLESRLNCDNLLGKDTSLAYLIRRYKGRSIVFCNSVDASRRVYGILSKMKIPALLLHAKMHQRARLKNLDRFTQREDSVLLATDVAARGLDIKGIDHVFHYQVPKTAELYIHRSGRTARASRRGLSILLVDPSEAGFYRRICSNLNRETDLPVFPIDCEPLFRVLKQQVKLASDLDTAEHQLRKKASRESWFEKAAKEMELELDHRDAEAAGTYEEMASLEAKERRLAKQLAGLLAQPLPDVDRASDPKTKYLNPELARAVDTKKTKEAMETVELSVGQMDEVKKKARKLLSTRNLHFNKKKGKK